MRRRVVGTCRTGPRGREVAGTLGPELSREHIRHAMFAAHSPAPPASTLARRGGSLPSGHAPRARPRLGCSAQHAPESGSRERLSRRAFSSAAAALLAASQCSGRAARAVTAMAGPKPFDVYVKGDPKKNVLGDCPFCHRVLLALEEKHVPYEKHYISFDDKPKLFDVNPKGSVPVIKIGEDKWLTDSAEIVDYLDEKYPDPPFGKTESIPEPANKIFPAFVQFLKSPESGEEAGEKEQAFTSALQKLDAHLAEHGPFLDGPQPKAGDVMLAPRLYHARTALKAFKGWTFPQNLERVKAYQDKWTGRDSWKNTEYSEDLVVAGWKAHVSS